MPCKLLSLVIKEDTFILPSGNCGQRHVPRVHPCDEHKADAVHRVLCRYRAGAGLELLPAQLKRRICEVWIPLRGQAKKTCQALSLQCAGGLC